MARRRRLTALRSALPSRVDALLLRATVSADADAAVAAWDGWQAAVGDPLAAWRATRSVARRHAVALHAAVERWGLPISGDLRTQLRLAVTRERLRHRVVVDAVADAFAALDAAAVPVVLVGGVAAATTYPDPLHRHVHDLDLLVEPHRLVDALRALEPLRAAGPSPWGHAHGARLAHRCGLPIALHTHPLDDAAFPWPCPRAAPHCAGLPVGVLGGEDATVRTAALALLGASTWSGTWALDLWHLLAATPELDAAVVAARAAATGTAPALQVALPWWQDALGAPSPVVAAVLERLGADAVPTLRPANDALLTAVRRAAPGGAADVLRRAGRRRTHAARRGGPVEVDGRD